MVCTKFLCTHVSVYDPSSNEFVITNYHNQTFVCAHVSMCEFVCAHMSIWPYMRAHLPSFFFFFNSKKITGEQGSVTIIEGVLAAKNVEAPVFVSTRFVLFFIHAHQMSRDVHTETTQMYSQKQRNLVKRKSR